MAVTGTMLPFQLPKGARKQLPWLILSVSFGLMLAGNVHIGTVKNGPFTGIPTGDVVFLEGVCKKDGSKVAEGKYVFPLNMEAAKNLAGTRVSAQGTITAYVSAERPVYWGERVTLYGNFNKNSDENGGEDRLIFWADLAEDGRGGFAHRLHALRVSILSGVLNKIRSSGAESAPLFEALFLGIKDDLGTLESELFKTAGCTHILALSGMHLGILSGLLFLVLKPLAGKKWSFFAVSLFIGIYLWLTGFRSSLLRAGIMFFIFGTGTIFGKKVDIRSVFFITFLLLAGLTPEAVYSLSFQLSFLALGGILLLTPSIHSLLKGRAPDLVLLPISASVGAQTATAPLIAAIFGTLYPIGIVSSLIITPLITLFMTGGLAALVIPFSSVTGILYLGLDYVYNFILILLRLASRVPGLSINGEGIRYALWFCAALTIIVPLGRSLRYRKQHKAMLVHGPR